MIRKMPAPRNPFVAAAKFKKAGKHGKSEKALRRQMTINTQCTSGLVVGHRTFNPEQDEFESLGVHQIQSIDKSDNASVDVLK